MGEEVLWVEKDRAFDIQYSVPSFAHYLCLALATKQKFELTSSCEKLFLDTHEVSVEVEFYLEVV